MKHDGYKAVSVTVFSGRKVNEVEMRLVGIESVEQSSFSSWERPLMSNEATYFDVRCGGNAANASR